MNEPSDKAEPYKTAALPLSYGGNNQLENCNIKTLNRKEKPRLAGEMFLDKILRFVNGLFEHADGDGEEG